MVNDERIDQLVHVLRRNELDNLSEAYTLALQLGSNAQALNAVAFLLDEAGSEVERKMCFLDVLVNLDPARAAEIIGSRIVQEPQARLRAHMVWLLNHCSHTVATPALMQTAQEDPDTEIRIMAIAALAHIGDRRALPLLEQLQSDSTESRPYESSVAQAAQLAFQAIREQHSSSH